MSMLTINAGSSSIRFAFYGPGSHPAKLEYGKIERIGQPGAAFEVNTAKGKEAQQIALDAGSFRSAVDSLLEWLESQPRFAEVSAVGHRIVHGMTHSQPARVTPQLLGELKAAIPYDPEHLPQEIELIETLGRRFPRLVQVACFDTAFHRTMPRVATILPIPRRYESQGVLRYGFHGLSYTFLLQELARLGDPAAERGRVILAHLGNGASVAAVRDGRSIDTSMAFTPAAGLPMSTRSGDLDPGVLNFLARTEGRDASSLDKMVNHESGLLGISETSSDVRDLLSRENEDVRAAEAIDVFCYQTKKWIAAFAGALGGLDTLVFAGGIGENSAPVRARICEGLQFFGVDLDEARNREHAPLISAGRASVRVIQTDEESVIAHMTAETLARPPQGADV
ncbi:MAG: acetate/propionate family kinase [Steroidobacteraceae bacterium]|jgi:acetate kinase